MIQELWKQSISWDEDLPDKHKEQWLRWIGDIHNMTSIEVPRPYVLENISKTQLHIFCDSSKPAYGAVAYLRGIASENKIHTAFLMAKTRVSPVKTQTLPQLELLAALLGAEIFAYRKIPKISPGAYIFQRPFSRGLYTEGLFYGGKFAFRNRLG